MIESVLSISEINSQLSNGVNHLWNKRKMKLVQNDQFKNPEKYPELPESKRPTKLQLVLNDSFYIETTELLLSYFYNFETNQTISYEVLLIDFNNQKLSF